MSIISILNPKGGCGKTTLTTNLASGLREKGFSVLLVDSDPQGSARDWHSVDEGNKIPLVALDRPNNLKTLSSMAANYDFVLIDGAAKLEDMMAAAIKVSDYILIPVQPSPYDLWAASDLVDFIKARQEVTDGKPPTSFVISRAIQGTRLGQEILEAVKEYDLGVMDSFISQRQIYPQTAAEGKTVFQAGNADATAEMTKLTNEVLKFVKKGGK